MISRDEDFADVQIGARRTLGDDHAFILIENIQVAESAEEFKQLAQNGKSSSLEIIPS